MTATPAPTAVRFGVEPIHLVPDAPHEVIRPLPARRPGPPTYPSWVPEELNTRLRALGSRPQSRLLEVVRTCLPYLPYDVIEELLDTLSSIRVIESSLHLVKIWGNRLPDFAFDLGAHPGRREDYGIVCRKVVTDNGVARIVDAFDNTVTDADLRYHGLGTGTTAENQTDAALVTELTTEYTGNVRATGTFSQPSANVSRSVATNTLDAGTPAVTEHGVFSQAATGGGTLLDRSVFAAINLVGANGDALQSTYSLTVPAGS